MTRLLVTSSLKTQTWIEFEGDWPPKEVICKTEHLGAECNEDIYLYVQAGSVNKDIVA